MALPSITWAAVTAIAPALSSVPAGSQTAILAMVDRRVKSDAWGDLASDAKTFLAAHFGSLYQRGSGGGTGPVTDMAVGPVSVSYAAITPGPGATSLESTVWGQEFLRLRRGIAGLRGMVAA